MPRGALAVGLALLAGGATGALVPIRRGGPVLSPRAAAARPALCRSVASRASPLASAELAHPLVELASAIPSTRAEAEALAGPFFGASLFPYLAFIYFLNTAEANTPRGVVVGFAYCLVFVFGSIPAAIGAELLFGVSLADCDWLHGAAESLLTVTNLLTVLALRDAIAGADDAPPGERQQPWAPWVLLGGAMGALSAVSAAVPALASAPVHEPFLGGLGDLPAGLLPLPHAEPANALSVPCWLIHTTSLIEWLAAMTYVWKWADVSGNPRWRGLVWAMIPLHSSGLCAVTYHVLYNSVYALLPLQAALTAVGNTCCAYAAWRVAAEGGWRFEGAVARWRDGGEDGAADTPAPAGAPASAQPRALSETALEAAPFIAELFGFCLLGCYVLKYGELFALPSVQSAGIGSACAAILGLTTLNVVKWARRSADPEIDGWL